MRAPATSSTAAAHSTTPPTRGPDAAPAFATATTPRGTEPTHRAGRRRRPPRPRPTGVGRPRSVGTRVFAGPASPAAPAPAWSRLRGFEQLRQLDAADESGDRFPERYGCRPPHRTGRRRPATSRGRLLRAQLVHAREVGRGGTRRGGGGGPRRRRVRGALRCGPLPQRHLVSSPDRSPSGAARRGTIEAALAVEVSAPGPAAPGRGRDDLLRLAQPRENLAYGGLALGAALLGPLPVDLGPQPDTSRIRSPDGMTYAGPGRRPGSDSRRRADRSRSPPVPQRACLWRLPCRLPGSTPTVPRPCTSEDAGDRLGQRPATVGRMSTEENGGTAAPRTLAEALRARDDAALAALLRARPDLLTPVPNDLTQLATRAGTRASVVRALERLDRFALQTAEALAVAPDPARTTSCSALLAGDDGRPRTGRRAAAAPRALGTLREQALVWGGDDRLRLVRTARELLAPSPQHPSPTGLGPTVAEATAGMSPGRLQEIVGGGRAAGDARPGVRGGLADRAVHRPGADGRRCSTRRRRRRWTVLDRLVWGPPYGAGDGRPPPPPVRWLLDRGLLLPAAPRHGRAAPRGRPASARRAARTGTSSRCRPRSRPRARRTVHRLWTPRRPARRTRALATVEELLKDWDEGGPAGAARGRAERTGPQADRRRPGRVRAGGRLLGRTRLRGRPVGVGRRGRRAVRADPRVRRVAGAARRRALGAARRARGCRRPARPAWSAAGTPRAVRSSALGPGLDRSPPPRSATGSWRCWPRSRRAPPRPESVLARLRWERPLRGPQRRRPRGPRAARSASDARRPARRGSRRGRCREAEAARASPAAARCRRTRDGLLGDRTPGRGRPPPRRRPRDELVPPTEQLAARAAARARPAAARAARPRPAPGRPDGGRARPAGAAARRHARRARGRRVQGRRDGLPLHARLRAPRPGRRARPPSDLHAFLAAHSRTPVPQPLDAI